MNAELLTKIESDSLTRLTEHGFPQHPGNDYELHLMARHFRLAGFSQEEVKQALLNMVSFLSPQKREPYIKDILSSLIAGFLPEDQALPIFMGGGKTGRVFGHFIRGRLRWQQEQQ